MNHPILTATLTGALGIALGYSLPDAIDRLTNPIRDPANACPVVGYMPKRTFVSAEGTPFKSILIIPELTGYDCNGTVFWR